MRVMRLIPLLLALSLTGCVVDQDWEEFELARAPFANAWVDRGAAEFEVILAEGYTCPDGLDARIYLVEPKTAASETDPRPLALMLHGRNFDQQLTGGEHAFDEDRLNVDFAARQVESMLGMESALGPTAQGEGAWVAALLARGFAVVAPGNCWGDLWHGRGDNPYEERYLRYGAYLMSEAIGVASRRSHISAETLLVLGLGEGGRGVTELILDGVQIDGAVVDSSPDWLSPWVAQPTLHQPELEALFAIYDADLDGATEPTVKLNALRVALERDSLVHAVQDLGFRAPIVYAWSSLDERIDPALSQPAADTIQVNYPPVNQAVLDWAVPDHAPSNRDPAQATERLDWMLGRLGLLE